MSEVIGHRHVPQPDGLQLLLHASHLHLSVVDRSRVARPGEVRVAAGVSPEIGDEGGILSR